MKKLFKFLFILLLIPLILIVGAFTFLKFADLNSYKTEIENLAHKYADINLKINGDIDVAMSLKPTISLSDVDITKNDETKTKIARIGNALVEFSLLPLLHKQIEVNAVQTDNTEVFYAENQSVLINDLDVSMENYDAPINIAFDTTVAGTDIFGTATTSSLQKLRAENLNDIDLKTTVNALGYKLDFDGNIKDATEKANVSGKYNLEHKKTNINGNIVFKLTETIPYLKLEAQSENISVIDFSAQKTAGLSFISSAYAEDFIGGTKIPYEYLQMVDADISLDVKKITVQPDIVLTDLKGNASLKNGVFKADIANVVFEKNTISGQAEIKAPNTRPYIKINIKGDGFDLQKMQKKVDKRADASFWLIKSAQASELMPNTKIPYQYLQMANADASINLKKVVLNPGIILQNINTTASLKNGVLNTNIQNINAGDGSIKGSMNLNAGNKSMSAKITGNNIVLQKLYPPFSDSGNQEFYIKQGGVTNFDINLNTSGVDTNQYLSNLNGYVVSYIDPSVLKIKSLERLQGNIIVQILNNLQLNFSNKDVNLACAAVNGQISGGLIKFDKGIAVDAKDFYLVADGKINLQNDKINLDLQPFSGKLTDVNISSILGNLLKITGTISKPSLGINQTATAKNVIGAIASGGVYNVGDLMLSADAAPCHTALKGTIYAEHFKADTSVTGSVSQGYANTKDTIKNAGKNIKNQAKDIGNQFKNLFK